MDRRKNGDSNAQAPPRPPKSIPRVHRPRAPDPDTVDSPSSTHTLTSHPSYLQLPPHLQQQQQQPPLLIPSQAISRMNSNIINNHSSSISINSSTNSHRSVPSLQPPITAPLTPLQSNNRRTNSVGVGHIAASSSSSLTVNTFSRRRTEMPTQTTQQQQQQQQQRVPSVNSNSVTRSLTPSLLGAPTASLFTNAISAVMNRRSSSPVNHDSNLNLNNVNNNSNTVTLQIPRPEKERLPNEYVDAPFVHQINKPGSRHSLATSTVTNRNSIQSNGYHHTNISIIDGTNVHNNNNINVTKNAKIKSTSATSTIERPNLLAITKQPQPSLKNNTNVLQKQKEGLHQQFIHYHHEDNRIFPNSPNPTSNNNGLISPGDQLNSITCPQCNRCRCEECQRPRQLPSRWICNENFLCSAETIIDYGSCLCCVKGLYYHCAKDHEIDCDSETIRCAEDPCSCAPYKRVSRWGCLSVLSFLLPCLLCYWPMRGCVSLCAKCYAKHSRHGCRCNNNNNNNNNNSSSANNSRLNIINLTSSPNQDQISAHHYHRRSNNNCDLTPEKRLLDSSSNEY
jgi:protein sprouty homolog 2